MVSNMNFIFYNTWDNPSHWLICFSYVYLWGHQGNNACSRYIHRTDMWKQPQKLKMYSNAYQSPVFDMDPEKPEPRILGKLDRIICCFKSQWSLTHHVLKVDLSRCSSRTWHLFGHHKNSSRKQQIISTQKKNMKTCRLINEIPSTLPERIPT